MNLKIITIFLILLLAFVLRFWRLNSYPALNADEAAIGYNAYSLLQTGKDEHGNPWPIHFQSFNDYKPGLYFYLVLPFVKLLGLNEWAVRIPNAFLGVLSVYVLFLLVKELNKNYLLTGSKLKFEVEYIAAFMLAISPWHIHFSRGGWEVNTSTFLILLGSYLFIKGKKELKYIFLSFLVFSLSLYTYHAARIITPLLILGMLCIYRIEVSKNIKFYLIASLAAMFLLLPLAKDILKPEISSRAAGVGLFADAGPINRINEQRGEHSNFYAMPAKILHNKFINYSLAFLNNWTAHFHGLFLFLSGDDIQRDKVPETGQMYLLDIIWIISGFILMAKNITRENRLIIHWLLIAPLAAALTFQSPHALRSENMVIPLVIIAALGMSSVLTTLSKIQPKNLYLPTCLLIILLVSWGFIRYEHMYWIHMSKEYPFSSQYGVKELVSYVKENGNDNKNIIVTQRYDQPYILFLFYLKYPPENFQQSHILTSRDNYGFSTVGYFDKFIFKHINWESDKIDFPGSLIIGTKDEIPKETNIIKKIYGSNGYEYFDVVAN